MNDPAPYRACIGRVERSDDLLVPSPIRRLAATLDHETLPWQREEVPPLGHWLYFLPDTRQSEIGDDGHAELGGMTPDFGLPRRMWAGSRLQFLRPLLTGRNATRVTRIAAIEEKHGRTGRMMFVTMAHEISDGDGLCLLEEQDLVYREAARAGAPVPPAPTAPEWQDTDIRRTVTPDAVMLFRYSALTFNAHRIHYDADYTREVEHYPALIIHGPLVATMMVDHFTRALPAARISSFSFRALQPMFLGDSLTFHLREGDERSAIWVTKDDGTLTVRGEIGSKA